MADYPITAVARRTVLSGSAGTGPYAFNFPVLTQTDLDVYKDTTKLTLTTDYTVSVGSAGTGTVTLGVAASGSNTITIVGARAVQRTTDFVTAGDLLASSLNTELDSQTIFAQQTSEDADRAIKAPVTDPTSIDMTLPLKATRATKALGFDSAGDPVVSTLTLAAMEAGSTSAATSATAAATSATAAASSATAAASSATTSSNSATASANSATAAAASAAAAGSVGLTTRGDLLKRGASANERLAIGSANTVLTTNGTDPAWSTITNAMLAGSIDLTSKMTGTLPIANGGTAATSLTANGVLFGNGTSAIGATAVGTDGDILTSNGSGSAPTFQAAAGGGYNSMQVFTSTGTWSRPSGVTKVIVIVTAGGGGGGGTPNDSQRGGGAGGGTAIETIDVSGTSSAAVTVGAAGAAGAAGGNDGGAGGASSFASFCSATGGAGGEGSSGTGSDIAATAGGTGSGGDINLKGGDAYYFARSAVANWGGPPTGGGSYWGPGGVGQYRGSSVGGGTSGTYGSGGGGSNTAAVAGGYAGAAGGAGIVVVYEYK
tara:strand:+ start:1553 stop:3190 length:1638 start_codon:yes stop_codon:yes gene_type:complete